jgi:hypothetical protein
MPRSLPLRTGALALALGLAQPLAAQSPAPANLCAAVVASYQKLVDADVAPPTDKSFYPDSPLARLDGIADSGVSIAAHIAEVGKQQQPLAWARQQKPAWKLSAPLQEALDKAAFLDRLPETDFYAASRIEGTLGCYSSITFTVKKGRAAPAEGPPNWSGNDGDGCGVFRVFGKVADSPVAFEENYDDSPALSSTLSVAGWRDEKFAPACTISFRFAPRFSAQASYNDWDQSCTAKNCDALRQRAGVLVEAVETDPAAAEKVLLDHMTPAQRAEFQALQKDAQVSRPEKLADPADFTETSPLPLPLVVDGQVYLAELGHFAIGWRIYSDWSVKISERKGKNVSAIAVIGIGMAKGKLLSAEIK